MRGLSFSRDDSAPNALVGAARRVRIDDRHEIEKLQRRGLSAEQSLAWQYYDSIGEIKTAYNYFAAMASRVRLFAGFSTENSDVPVPIGDVGDGVARALVVAAREEIAKLSRGLGGQPNLIRGSVLNLLVAGEYYLIGESDHWSVRSTSELKVEADGKMRLSESRIDSMTTARALDSEAFVARIWRTHPRYSADADSALLGMLDDCAELLMTARLIRASAKSRLNAGILYVADELRFQRASDPGGSPEPEPDVDPFEEELTIALTETIGDTDSPSEVVPLLVRGPAALSETGIRQIDLSRSISKVDVERFEQLISRVLRNLDVPSDLITGLANVRYSNGKTISEDFLKGYIEPMVLIICEALTTVYLRPKLLKRGFGHDVVDRVSVWYDPSEIVTRPDRSADADRGYERMLISGRTWRRAHGFSETDAPDNDEQVQRIALASGAPQSLALDFLRLLAPEVIERAERLAQEAYENPSTPTPEEPEGLAKALPAVPEPPPEGELPPMDAAALQLRAANILRAITAAAAPAVPSSEVRQRERALERSLDAERRLREVLHVFLNDTVHRALERAGARTISKTVRKDAEMKTILASVTAVEAYAAVPEDRLGEFALEDAASLVADTIAGAQARYAEILAAAQTAGWLTLGAAVLEAMRPTQADRIAESWQWLSGRLTRAATFFLKNPDSRRQYVSMTTVRDAATLAGGASHVENAPDDLDLSRSSAVDSGRAVLSAEALSATGWNFGERYRWVYGISDKVFEPHRNLDDTIFSSWEGSELASTRPEEFPFVSHFFPGDHKGCRCDWLPEVLDPAAVNAPVRGNTANVPIS